MKPEGIKHFQLRFLRYLLWKNRKDLKLCTKFPLKNKLILPITDHVLKVFQLLSVSLAMDAHSCSSRIFFMYKLLSNSHLDQLHSKSCQKKFFLIVKEIISFLWPFCIEIVILLLATICSGLRDKMLSDKTRFSHLNISSYVHTKYKIHIHSPGV